MRSWSASFSKSVARPTARLSTWYTNTPKACVGRLGIAGKVPRIAQPTNQRLPTPFIPSRQDGDEKNLEFFRRIPG